MDWLFPALFWFLAVWLAGWIALPLSRTVLGAVPDGGLAAGRVLFFAFSSLLAFWLASLGLVPLHLVPLIFLTVALASISTVLACDQRRDFLLFVRARWRTLLFSDSLFALAFCAFLWLRLRHPELNSLEKPMDSGMLSTLLRSDFLPPENFWFSGLPFTNYYYFGQFVSANIARTLGTPPLFAYNLAYPMWCAFFLSALWPLCAALCSDKRTAFGRGVAATIFVALLGHYEPLRQVAETGRWWPLDWWKTSRVIPDTINEYPAFTLAAGDLHAHFFTFSFTIVACSLCYALLHSSQSTVEFRVPTAGRPDTRWRATQVVLGVLLGLQWMTNTWDVPVSALIILACGVLSRPRDATWRDWLWLGVPPIVAYLVSWPYRHLFAMPLSNAHLDLFVPPLQEFLLFWGLMLAMAALALTSWWKQREDAKARTALVFLAGGGIALVVPYLCYVQSALFSGGAFNHLNMVFKMGLQAWLLLGVAAACGVLNVWAKAPLWIKSLALPILVVPALCSACVFWTWGWRDAPRDAEGNFILSLDGARFLSPDDHAALTWLMQNARPGENVVEAVSDRAYERWGRVSWLSGVPTPLGWLQHSRQFGVDETELQRRFALITRIYNARSEDEIRGALDELKPLRARWIFIGDLERETSPPESLALLRASCAVAFESGGTVVLRVP